MKVCQVQLSLVLLLCLGLWALTTADPTSALLCAGITGLLLLSRVVDRGRSAAAEVGALVLAGFTLWQGVHDGAVHLLALTATCLACLLSGCWLLLRLGVQAAWATGSVRALTAVPWLRRISRLVKSRSKP